MPWSPILLGEKLRLPIATISEAGIAGCGDRITRNPAKK